MAEAATPVLLGTQGWSYSAWVGPFYPKRTAQAAMLGLYARAFPTVEVDSTFYGIPAEPVVREWRERVPKGFVFSLKVPQEITHTRQLVDVEPAISQFLSRVDLLEDRLGPLLVQMSPAFRATAEHRSILAAFLEGLPRAYRWVFEFRDAKWITADVLDLLHRRQVALALVDGRWLRRHVVMGLVRRPTADFGYVRWMGPTRTIIDYSRVQVDRSAELTSWAEAIRTLRSRVRTIFGYFNNHFEGHGPHSVRELQRIVGQVPVEPGALQTQVELFG